MYKIVEKFDNYEASQYLDGRLSKLLINRCRYFPQTSVMRMNVIFFEFRDQFAAKPEVKLPGQYFN